MLKDCVPRQPERAFRILGAVWGDRSDRASLAPFRTYCLTCYFRAPLEKAGLPASVPRDAISAHSP